MARTSIEYRTGFYPAFGFKQSKVKQLIIENVDWIYVAKFWD
jgi:hypothetical protein